MAKETTEYTHVGVTVPTQKKIALLAKIKGTMIRDLVGSWADEAWEAAKDEGIVTDAMIAPAKSPVKQKKSAQTLEPVAA